MAVFLEKKPLLVRNGIVQQLKQAANSLTIQEWNNVVNTLKTQTNLTVEYLEKLHRALFGIWEANTSDLQEFVDEGIIYDILAQIEEIKDGATLKTNFYGKADEAITKGDFIMFGGAQGDHILFKKADVNSEGFIPEYIMGVAESTMAQGDFGYVRWFGPVQDLELKENDENIEEGKLLWVGQTPGTYTTTEPAVGSRILMAVIEKASTGNAANGVMLVRPTIGNSHDFNIVNAQDGDFLRYDSTSKHFKNITANKVVVSETEPTNNESNDLWFDI